MFQGEDAFLLLEGLFSEGVCQQKRLAGLQEFAHDAFAHRNRTQRRIGKYRFERAVVAEQPDITLVLLEYLVKPGKETPPQNDGVLVFREFHGDLVDPPEPLVIHLLRDGGPQAVHDDGVIGLAALVVVADEERDMTHPDGIAGGRAGLRPSPAPR